jgi:hypothetical protein
MSIQTQIKLSGRLYAAALDDQGLELDVLEHLNIDEQTISPFLDDTDEAQYLIPDGWKLSVLREGKYIDKKTGRAEFVCFLTKGNQVAKGSALSEACAITVSILKADSINKLVHNRMAMN